MSVDLFVVLLMAGLALGGLGGVMYLQDMARFLGGRRGS